MAKRKKTSFLRLETIIISVFVLSFFIWALSKINIGEKVSSIFSSEDEATPIETPIDSLQSVLDELRPIYITIDNLNMRDQPSLKGSILKKIPLYERVYFTGIITDSTTTVNIGRVVTEEPWVKVITEDGTEGWLYGAGVHFYKTQNPNAIFN